MFGFPTVSPEEMRDAISHYLYYVTQERTDTPNSIFNPEVVFCDPSVPLLQVCFPIEQGMLNTNGMCHGGVITTAYDLTMGILARWYQGGDMSPTLSMSFTFLRPVPADCRLIIEVRPIGAGKHYLDFTCRAWPESCPESIANTAEGRFFIRKAIDSKYRTE